MQVETFTVAKLVQASTSTVVRERAMSKRHDVIEEDDTLFSTPRMMYTEELSYDRSELEVIMMLKRSTTCFSGTRSGPGSLPQKSGSRREFG